MFKNIGETIKNIAQSVIILGMIFSIILLVVGFSTWDAVYEILTPISTLLGSFLLGVLIYAFGEFMCYMKSISESLQDLSHNENQKDIDYEYEEDEIVKCPYCNSDMESDAFFCPSCHKKVVK